MKAVGKAVGIIVGWLVTSGAAMKWADVVLGYAMDKYDLVEWVAGLTPWWGGVAYAVVLLVAIVLPVCIMGGLWYLVGCEVGVWGAKRQ